jgi:hypothetical protein
MLFHVHLSCGVRLRTAAHCIATLVRDRIPTQSSRLWQCGNDGFVSRGVSRSECDAYAERSTSLGIPRGDAAIKRERSIRVDTAADDGGMLRAKRRGVVARGLLRRGDDRRRRRRRRDDIHEIEIRISELLDVLVIPFVNLGDAEFGYIDNVVRRAARPRWDPVHALPRRNASPDIWVGLRPRGE